MKHNKKVIYQIQAFLDNCEYNKNNFARCAMRVLKEKKAHCLEGALYAAWQLEQHNMKPYLLDMRAIADDDHVVCLYKINGKWGAIGKSNTSLLRGRDAIYPSVEKLVYSYFPFYFNNKGKMSLHQWSGPIPMSFFKKFDWREGTGNMQMLSQEMEKLKAKTIILKKDLLALPKVSNDLFNACFHYQS
jgi:hypothetical protein